MLEGVTDIIGTVPAKLLALKYDKRYGRKTRFRPVRANTGIANAVNKLPVSTARTIFNVGDVKAKCLALLESKDERLRFEVIRYLWDRVEGKPFTANNPLENTHKTVDSRLQVAIRS